MNLGHTRRSTLHLQMGQETIYLLLTIAVFAALVLAAYVAVSRKFEDPPIITLSESQGFFFKTGSADLSKAFADQLRVKIAPRVREIAERYDAHTVEVIGHTDEVPLGPTIAGRSNLDRTLVPWFTGNSATAPAVSDNAGLGMARAVSVARALRESGLAKSFTIVPLSAGAFLKPDDTVTDGTTLAPDETRRRIEIRVRRSARQIRPATAPSRS